MKATLDVIKTKLGFVLTFMSIFGFFALAIIKDIDVSVVIPTILGIYIASKTITTVNNVTQASSDEKCDTESVISKQE